MRRIALRKSIEGMDGDLAKETAAVLRTAFADVERFFEAKDKHDGHQWASDALKVVASIAGAVAASKWDDVKASAGNLGKVWQTCHTSIARKPKTAPIG